jgi:hypothetical protein
LSDVAANPSIRVFKNKDRVQTRHAAVRQIKRICSAASSGCATLNGFVSVINAMDAWNVGMKERGMQKLDLTHPSLLSSQEKKWG